MHFLTIESIEKIPGRAPAKILDGEIRKPCDIGGAIWVASGMMYFPHLNEELKNPKILKIIGYLEEHPSS